jgi:hypothetical protein
MVQGAIGYVYEQLLCYIIVHKNVFTCLLLKIHKVCYEYIELLGMPSCLMSQTQFCCFVPLGGRNKTTGNFKKESG